jgi:Zn-dependent peptidase ImmA (M78 family)
LWRSEMVRRPLELPVKHEVLKWAREYRGYSLQQAAELLEIGIDKLTEFESGATHPSPSILRKMATVYHQSESILLLPSPPETRDLPTDFRTVGGRPINPSPDTVLAIREAQQLQDIVTEVVLSEPELIKFSTIPEVSGDDDPEAIAELERERFGISVEEQAGWRLAQAFEYWRVRVESTGILVLVKSMPWNDCRGVSIWESRELVPVIVVNSDDTPSAKSFTLFHEYAHLLRRNSGMCIKEEDDSQKGVVERWCNRFAAAFLMPADSVRSYISDRYKSLEPREWTVEQIRLIANHFRVSRPATALRLERLSLAPRGYYDRNRRELNRFDQVTGGGGGGTTRRPGWRQRQRLREVGLSAVTILIEGCRAGALDSLEASNALRLNLDELSTLETYAEVERRQYAGT